MEPLAPLFGTDGIRDTAGQGRLELGLVVRVGRALARHAARRAPRRVPVVALGRDPRPSGPSIVLALSRGLAAEGAEVVDLGELPTPGVALAAAAWGHDLGVMVSASHNPEADNGIKPFGAGGRKLSTEEEREIEADVRALSADVPAGPAPRAQPGAARYVKELLAALAGGPSLAGLRLVVDVAAGATSSTVPGVLEGLGVKARLLHPARSRAINDHCGSEHPEAWLAAVRADKADAGLAFDGDGDRVLVADATGALLDGDDLLAILAEDLAARGALPGSVVVSTVMSNLGLDERLSALGVRLERTAVGDRNVAERMRDRGAVVGGEASGHVVLARPLPGSAPALIGDALFAGVQVLKAARRLGRTLAELRAQRPRYPQRLKNVPMRERRPLELLPRLLAEVHAVEASFGGKGRVVVRPSGTEPLLRIMVEHREAGAVDAALARLERVAREEV